VADGLRGAPGNCQPDRAKPLVFAGGEAGAANSPRLKHEALEKKLPRIPLVAPVDALATFRTLPGFHIEQVVAEPLVQSPVAIAFDERGRMYVCEMIDYPFDRKGPRGQVRRLEDVHNTGRFEKSTVFADDIPWPTGITCYAGGVFVAAAPDILYLKSTNSDGKANVRKVVFTGFGHDNVQALVNSLQWGTDNRIHGATSFNPARVRRPDQPESAAIGLRGRDFSFDPRTLDLRAESGGGQYGMTFDDWGRKFVCSNSDHLQIEMYEDRYLARNPFVAALSPHMSIAADGPAAAVFRISPVEPWRILRTKMRVAGEASGPIEGGGTPAGYFTSATGITIYRGDSWAAEYRGQAFIGEVAGNLVHRKVISEDAVTFVGRRVDTGREFLASTDIWFRPVAMANAPDGTLYVADMCREVIEHPESLPDVILKQVDLTSGRERGRIYRIVPDGFKQRPPPRLDEATAPQLVATLEHRNGWHRDTAARLLFERQDSSAVGPLERLAAESALPEARAEAMYSLAGLKSLSPEAVLRALSDHHPRVREHAVRLSESIVAAAGAAHAKLRSRLLAMVEDQDIRVRYQLAFSLGVIPQDSDRNAALAKLLARGGGDPWMRMAVFTSLSEGSAAVFAVLVADYSFCSQSEGRKTLEQLARQIGAAGRGSETAAVLKAIGALSKRERPLAVSLLFAFAEGWARNGRPLNDQLVPGSKVAALWKDAIVEARQKVEDASATAAIRTRAIRTLGLDRSRSTRDLLVSMLSGSQSQDVQLEALAALDQFNDPEVGPILVRAWPALTPQLRIAAGDALYARKQRLIVMLKAVEDGKIPPSDLDRTRLKVWENSADGEFLPHVRAVAAMIALGRRKEVVESYMPALKLKGEAQRGKVLFEKNCASCHRLEGVGHDVGPNLAALQARGPESILVNVLDPNREVNPQYVDYIVETSDGRVLTGLLSAETAVSITLKQPGGVLTTVLRADIDRIRGSGLSLMPEGLEKSLDQQALADVIAYIMAAK
jgi:putative membrane-bound dehydrogenase-like protein